MKPWELNETSWNIPSNILSNENETHILTWKNFALLRGKYQGQVKRLDELFGVEYLGLYISHLMSIVLPFATRNSYKWGVHISVILPIYGAWMASSSFVSFVFFCIKVWLCLVEYKWIIHTMFWAKSNIFWRSACFQGIKENLHLLLFLPDRPLFLLPSHKTIFYYLTMVWHD